MRYRSNVGGGPVLVVGLRSLVPRRRERGTCDRDRRVTHVAPCERSPRTEIENIDFQNICQLWALIIEVAKDDFVHLALYLETLICLISLYSVCLCYLYI